MIVPENNNTLISIMIFKSPYPDLEIPEQNLADVVMHRAADLTNKPAIIDGPSGRTYTYGQLQALIEKFAAGLAARGFKKGDVLGIYMPNVPEYSIAFLGTAALGGINTTINSLYSPKEVAFQLNDSGAKFLLTIPQFLETATQAAAQSGGVEEIFVLGEAEGATPFSALLDNDGNFPAVTIDPAEDLVALPYSSGTTGLSKGVMLTHRNLIANMVLASSQGHANENDVFLGLLPFFHIYGMVLILNMGLYQGGTMVTMPRFELEQFLQIAQQYKLSYLSLVPPLVLALAKSPQVDDYDLSNVRMIGSGAAPLGKELEEAVSKRLGCIVYQGYGLTEVSGASHVNPPDPEHIKSGSVGPAVANCLTRVVDVESGEDLGPNQQGEIWIKGPFVMKGYLNNEEATANTIDADGWFHSGDIGYADDDGYFYIVDRLKELIKYKAYQVAPAELEALLLTHPAIADAAVIPSPDEEAGEVPKAFVVLKGEITPQEIMDWVADQVAFHKKIRRLEIVDEIPKSSSGKILRRVLVDRERQSLQAGTQ
jgi:acyl-CoA synthetase (AMP-forming)/AMP-acid ligase II